MSDDIREKIICIIKKYDYKTIILFGSRSRNEQIQKSDYDLLIITNKEIDIKSSRKIQASIRMELALIDIDVDVLVKTEKTIEYYKNKRGNVIYEAIKEGIKI